MSPGRHVSAGVMLLGGAAGTGMIWAVSMLLFFGAARGLRGMDKPWFFDLWEAGTWVIGPLLICALAIGGVAFLARAAVVTMRAQNET